MSDSEVSDISDIDTQPVKTRRQKAQEDVAAIKADKPAEGQRKTIVIHQSDTDGGDKAVFVGVNGVGYQIPRGKPWDVPVEVIEALNNAVVTRYSSGKDGTVVPMNAPRYAFSVT